MAYQVSRSKHIKDVLELCDEDGNVVQTLDIDIDADVICTQYRKRQIEIINAERQLKEVQRNGLQSDIDAAFFAYSNAVKEIFLLVFGEENTKIIIDFYNGQYIEMSVQLVPYIYNVIAPALEDALKRRKAQVKSAYKRKF